jgi:hypothetical protein
MSALLGLPSTTPHPALRRAVFSVVATGAVLAAYPSSVPGPVGVEGAPGAGQVYDGRASYSPGRPAVVRLEGSAEGGRALTFAIVDGPDHGRLAPLGPVVCAPVTGTSCGAAMTYVADPRSGGRADRFRFRAADQDGRPSRTATVTLVPATFTPDPFFESGKRASTRG